MAVAPPTKPSNAGLFCGLQTAVGFEGLEIFRRRCAEKMRNIKALRRF